MVWNRRYAGFANQKKYFSSDKLAPYLLHVLMVVAVAAYVILGAAAIRAIEGIEKPPDQGSQNIDLSHASKSEKYWHSIQQQKAKDSSKMDNGVTERSLDQEPEQSLTRVKRRASLNRSRKCVTMALKKIAIESKCKKESISTELMAALNSCYEDDLRNLVRRAQEEEASPPPTSSSETVVTSSTVLNPEVTLGLSTKNETIVEYEYWTWTDAILFCFTVITTIGYGNVAPRTLEGQVFVIIYGLFGVPFSMVVIANLGKFLAELLKTWMKPFKILGKKCYRKLYSKPKITTREKQNLVNGDVQKHVNFPDGIDSDSDSSLMEESIEDGSVHKDAASLFIAFVLYVIVGSIIIASYEPEMDTFKAIYYIFVSLTTIGLGDVIPKSESYLAFTLIYIAVGLALTTIAIEIASDYLKKLHYFGRRMENVGNVQIWFGSKKLTMKQLVKNLGDQFNLPVDDMQGLNLDTFVDNAIKVEEGILPTLRNSQYPYGIKPIFVTDFRDAGNVIYADEDERYIVYNFTRETYEKLPPPPPNGGFPLPQKKSKK